MPEVLFAIGMMLLVLAAFATTVGRKIEHQPRGWFDDKSNGARIRIHTEGK